MMHQSRGLRIVTLALLLLLAASMSCRAGDFGIGAPTATPVPPVETEPPDDAAAPTEVVPTIPPSDTPVPETPTPAPTATPSEVTVTAAGGEVACRFGPASEYSVEGKLAAGVTTLALARNGTSSWIRIEHQTRPGRNCWLKAEDVVVTGNLESVPVQAAPAAIVTNVTVDVSPSKATVPGCAFPYTFEVQFTITVTGPGAVKLQRSKSDGSAAPVETQTFTSSGTFSFADSLRVGSEGDHWFQVEVSSPNAMTGRGTAKASCP